jgi:superfamily II DNA or RNA helicase
MVEVIINNATSRLIAPRPILRDVRHLVSFRAADLPPVAAQSAIKGWMREHGTWGGAASTIASMVANDDLVTACAEADFDLGAFTPAMLEAIKRIRGLWDGWKPLVDSTGTFPTGLLGHVRRALILRLGVEVAETDARAVYRPRGPLTPLPGLFDYQIAAQAAFLARERGVVDLPPRSGKTRIAVSIVVALGEPALFVAPTVGIVGQTEAAFRENLPARDVVAVTGGEPDARTRRVMNGALVWIVTAPTAAKLTGIESRRVLVLDEFHHASCDTFQTISERAVNAYWRLGLTGTHYRADGRDMEMRGVLAETVYRRTVGEMVAMGRLVPARIAMVRVPGSEIDARGREVYTEGVVDHVFRNLVLVRAAQELRDKGRRVLVLAKEIRHAGALAEAIGGAVAVDGGDNERADWALKELAEGRLRVVVGTSVIGEGRDVPAADALVYAAGGSSRVKVKQDVYRVLTVSRGKTRGIIVDMADNHHPRLCEAAAERLALYREESSFTTDIIEPSGLTAWLAE